MNSNISSGYDRYGIGYGSGINNSGISVDNGTTNYLANDIKNILAGFGSNSLAYGMGNMMKYGETSLDAAADQASLDTTLAYDKAAGTQSRNMERMGINPNSGRYQGAQLDMNLQRAAAEAGARNQARITARQQNFQNASAIADSGNKSLASAATMYANREW